MNRNANGFLMYPLLLLMLVLVPPGCGDEGQSTTEIVCTTVPGNGRTASSGEANNSPTMDTVAVSFKACSGETATHSVRVFDPDGDEVTLSIEVAYAPQGAELTVMPDGPVTLSSDGTITINVTCDKEGSVKLDYSVIDANELEGVGPYSAVFQFFDCGLTPGS
jgi:hypothetical protein